MQNPQSLQTTCVHVPPEATILYGIQEFLTNSRKYLCTFQLFIDTTRQQFFGHNNIRVMNTSVGFIFQIFWIMWSVCHTQSASHSNTKWLQMSGHSQNAKWYDSVEECWLRTRKRFTCGSSPLLFTHLNLK